MISTTEVGPVRALVRDVARSYVIGRVRELATGHDALFDRGLRLYSLIEQEIHGDRPAAVARARRLLEHPLARTVKKLLSERMRHILDAALDGMEDNRRIMAALQERVGATGATERACVEQLYREVLVATVPYERSQRNVAAIVDTTRLVHNMITTRSMLKRALRREGYAFVRRVIIQTDRTRAELDQLWKALRAEPAELLTLADSVARYGPQVVDDIYGTGGGADT